MEKVAEKLDGINQTLERQNRIIQQMVDNMPRPESRFMKMLLIAGATVGALGIIQIIDTILKWF